MIRKFLVAAASILFFSTLSFAETDDLTKQNLQMFQPVVQVNSNCSGTIFHSQYDEKLHTNLTLILTAKHCTKELGAGELVEIETQKYDSNLALIGSTNYIGNVILKSKQYDLAVIMLKDKSVILPAAKIGFGPYQFGQVTYAVGYPKGLSKTITTGNLGYREYIPRNHIPAIPSGEIMSVGDNEYQRSTAMIKPGSSGGPLFTKDINGDYVLIGVASMLIGDSEFMALYTPIDQINLFLNGGM